MKTTIYLTTWAVVAAMSIEAARAALNIPSDGSDGALVIAGNTVIDLSQAATGNWDDNNAANAGKGIYDSNKWAVVFKYSSVVVLPSGTAPLIWMPANGPTVRIVSIGGNSAPADPRAGFGAIGADVVLPRVSSTTVVLETANVEQASVVTVRATPRSNGNFSEAPASVTEVISQDPLVARWTANVPVQDGYSAIQVKVVRP
jgi:hypothetical protein